VRTGAQLSATEARWMAIGAQGLGRARPSGPIGAKHVRSAIDAVGTIQLDAINVLERTQFLVLFSRLGAYDRDRLHALTGPGGELFEYWGHAASLVPMRWQPLFRWRMEAHGPYGTSDLYAQRAVAWHREHKTYIDAVLDEVRERGPLTASQLSDPQRRDGEWWDRRSLGRQALEWLFFRGLVCGWRASNFERVYDIAERVIPPPVLAEPTPPEDEAHRRLLLHAARSLGVATARELADYYRINTKRARPRLAELVDAGELVLVEVEGWREPGLARPDARVVRPQRRTATLLSPFDSLIWERERTSRFFAFDYRIEVYVPEPKRRYGYYVLPLLLGDELVARFDLKADRKASVLRVNAAHAEPGADPATVAEAAAVELGALRAWLGLGAIAVGRRGTLAPALRRAVAAA
jgi:uncharacterized protein YcaQ